MRARPPAAVGLAIAYTAAVLGIGYAAFGLVTMLVFTAGFLGGLVLWLLLSTRGTWASIRGPFWLTVLLFLAHRVEEKQFGFFAMLSSVTGVPTPAVASPVVIGLVLLSVGGWLLVPWLMKLGKPLGDYFAWTFFASMGITELAHWAVFPFLQGPGVHAVPGMWSVLFLAPAAWFGMSRLHGINPGS